MHGIAAAQKLAAILSAQPGGDNENVMVASFGSEQIDAFHAAMPGHDSISGSLPETEQYVLPPVDSNDPFVPEIQAIQPPDKYNVGGTLVDAPELIKAVVDSRGDDYAIHVWGADGTVENDTFYKRMVDAKVQGFFPQESTKLAAFLWPTTSRTQPGRRGARLRTPSGRSAPWARRRPRARRRPARP